MNDYIVYDTETKLYNNQVEGGWDNVYGMGLASAVTYSSATDLYRFWSSDNQEELLKYLHNRLVVSFNGIMFDSLLLLGNDRLLMPNGMTCNKNYSWVNCDIYVEMWRRILGMDKNDYPLIVKKIKEQKMPKGVFNLDSISQATLRTHKFGHGIDAPKLFQDGKIMELFQYNLQDVRVTTKLFQFIQKYKYLVTGSSDVVEFN